MNPYVILGVVVAFVLSNLGSYFYGDTQGHKVERSAWLAKENVELSAANAKILSLEKAARNAEAAHAAALNLVSTTYQGELNAARAETKRLADAAHDGAFRLRVHAKCEDSGGSGTAETLPSAGRRDGQAGGQLPEPPLATLSASDSAFLIELTGEADEVARQLSACQAVVVEDRR